MRVASNNTSPIKSASASAATPTSNSVASPVAGFIDPVNRQQTPKRAPGAAAAALHKVDSAVPTPAEAAAENPSNLLRYYDQLFESHSRLEERIKQTQSPVAASSSIRVKSDAASFLEVASNGLGISSYTTALLIGALFGILLAFCFAYSPFLLTWLRGSTDAAHSDTALDSAKLLPQGHDVDATVAEIWRRIEQRLDAWAINNLRAP